MANDDFPYMLRTLLVRDPATLGAVSAALWALVGRPITVQHLEWASQLWGSGAPMRLWRALQAVEALDGEPACLQPRRLARVLAQWVNEMEPMKACMPAVFPLVVTFPYSGKTETNALCFSTALVRLIDSATQTVLLCAPYIDVAGIGSLLDSLRSALLRRVILTIISRDLDRSRSPNAQAVALLRRELRGIPGRVQCYTATVALHAKLVIADGCSAIIGSANLTGAGMHDNIELGIALDGTVVIPLVTFVDELIRMHLVVPVGELGMLSGSAHDTA